MPSALELWLGVAAFAVVLPSGGWSPSSGSVHPQFLPSPRAVRRRLVGLFQTRRLSCSDIGISIAASGSAFLASAVIAIPLGILMSSYRASAPPPSR